MPRSVNGATNAGRDYPSLQADRPTPLPWRSSQSVCAPVDDASPVVKTVKVLTLAKSRGSFSLNLWDEKQKKLMSLKSLKETHGWVTRQNAKLL